jgi:hypothetical protein
MEASRKHVHRATFPPNFWTGGPQAVTWGSSPGATGATGTGPSKRACPNALIKFVERVARLMRIPSPQASAAPPAAAARGPAAPMSGLADGFAAAARPDAGREAASRRSSAIDGSKSPLLGSDGGVISSVAFFAPTQAAVFAARRVTPRPSPRAASASEVASFGRRRFLARYAPDRRRKATRTHGARVYR